MTTVESLAEFLLGVDARVFFIISIVIMVISTNGLFNDVAKLCTKATGFREFHLPQSIYVRHCQHGARNPCVDMPLGHGWL